MLGQVHAMRVSRDRLEGEVESVTRERVKLQELLQHAEHRNSELELELSRSRNEVRDVPGAAADVDAGVETDE